MILLRLKSEKVVEVVQMTSPYTPKEDEVLVDRLPPIQLESDEIALIYYINNEIVYKKEKRGNSNAI